MQYYNNILAIEARWLISQGIVSEGNYSKLAQRGDLQVVRRGCRGQEALVSYESMPERFRRQVDAVVGDAYKAARVNVVEEAIEHSAAASSFFDEYTLEDGRHLPQDKRREYYANAIVLDAIHKITAHRSAKRRALGSKSVRQWEQIAETVMEIDRTRYPHDLPQNARSLERKYKEYQKTGYESLIHKTYITQNKNAAKVLNAEQQSVMVMLISDPRKLDNEQVASMYNVFAGEMGWKTITGSAVAVWRDRLGDTIYARRNGRVADSNNKAMQVKRRRTEYALCYWTMDGWDAELLYQAQTTRKDGTNVTTYHNSVTVVVVLDTCCKYPIGYAIGDHETPALIREALRNAERHVEELFGRMYRVQQLQSDNYAIKNLRPLYEQISKYVTPASVHNAKTKIIEPWFKYFNKTYCQMQPNWSGFGVTSRKELQPNNEALNAYRKDFPDYEGVCQQIDRFMAMERAKLIEEYRACFAKMPAEYQIALPREQYLLAFGERTERKALMRGNGLLITISGHKRQYDCFDQQFRQHASTPWTVCYDPTDPSKAMAINEDETLQFMLEEKYVQPMALVDRTAGDSEELQRVHEFNYQRQVRNYETMCEHEETFIDLVHGNRELATLSKLLIPDSTGQHKDQRNAARLSPSKRKAIAYAEVVEDDADDIYNLY